MSGGKAYRALAHAKLNLYLHVLARESSGYHQIETLFCTLELADDVEITRAPAGIALDVVAPPGAEGTVPDLGPLADNLAYRAAEAFARAAGVDPGVRIRLTKRIPAGAGLGGGSSDAAAVLAALNEMHGRPLPASRLLTLGAQLGSDVPFFLTDAALALAWGRGDRVAPLPPLPAVSIVLAVPPERISTAAAYAASAASPGPIPARIEIPRAWTDVALTAHNDFEAIVFPQHPRLAALRQMLEGEGALIARMTGTGSVVFGVFEDDAVAEAAARRVRESHADVTAIVTRTRSGAARAGG